MITYTVLKAHKTNGIVINLGTYETMLQARRITQLSMDSDGIKYETVGFLRWKRLDDEKRIAIYVEDMPNVVSLDKYRELSETIQKLKETAQAIVSAFA